MYGKTQLKRVALDHCGAEITVELYPLARETQKETEAVKLTGGFLGLKWTAASKHFTEVFTLLLLALPVPDSYHCCYRKDSLHSALAEDHSVMSQPQLNHTMLLHIMYTYTWVIVGVVWPGHTC